MTCTAPASAALAAPDPFLTDGEVVLRPWRDEDTDVVTVACQDPTTQAFIPIPRPYRRQDAEAYIARTRIQWALGTHAAFAIADAADPSVLLGAIDVALFGSTGNAAYWVVPSARHRGVATRALSLVTQWALQAIPLVAVILEIRPENVASQHVAAAAGFHVVGRLDVNDVTGDHDGLIFARFAAVVDDSAVVQP